MTFAAPSRIKAFLTHPRHASELRAEFPDKPILVDPSQHSDGGPYGLYSDAAVESHRRRLARKAKA